MLSRPNSRGVNKKHVITFLDLTFLQLLLTSTGHVLLGFF